MPRDGTGNYTLPSGNPVVSGTTISSSGWANPTLTDIASALTGSLARDGQAVPTANLPMGNFRHTGVADAQNTNEYATVNQIQNVGLTVLGATLNTAAFHNLTASGTASITGAITGGTSLAISGATQIPVTVSTTNSSGYQKMSCSGGAKYLGVVGNSFVVVNQGNTAILLTIDDSGNLTTTGDLKANSDERLKTDWAELPTDFIDRLAAVRSGTYSRIDIDQRQAGVGAQSLRTVLPEAVHESEKGILSVAYGQAALVACVELAKEVMRLRALLEPTQ